MGALFYEMNRLSVSSRSSRFYSSLRDLPSPCAGKAFLVRGILLVFGWLGSVPSLGGEGAEVARRKESMGRTGECDLEALIDFSLFLYYNVLQREGFL